MKKEGTDDNVGGFFINYFEQAKFSDFTARVGFVVREGKASPALRAA